MRRGAVIIIEAPRGDVRAAKGLVGRAIRGVLGVRKWHTAPHLVTYLSVAEMKGYGVSWPNPRFTLEVTDAELDAVSAEIDRLAADEGWSRAPVDIYHD